MDMAQETDMTLNATTATVSTRDATVQELRQETELKAFKSAQTLVLSRDDLIGIFSEWKKRAVEGEWEKVSDNEIDPARSADTFIEIAFQL